MKVPFVVYSDFGALNKAVSEDSLTLGKTETYQKHHASRFCFQIVCFDESIQFPPVLYRAESEKEDVEEIFVEMLENETKRIHKVFDFSKKMIFTEDDKKKFEESEFCWICRGKFENKRKVRDHCHFTGTFRGAAHEKCNLQFRKPNFSPVIFHNLSGYDSHLFIKNLGKNSGGIKAIPNNEEKYISFSKEITVGSFRDKQGKEKLIKHEIRFVDSFKFMGFSLED